MVKAGRTVTVCQLGGFAKGRGEGITPASGSTNSHLPAGTTVMFIYASSVLSIQVF
jgi:hypothetical protein